MIKIDYQIEDFGNEYAYRIFLERWIERVSFSEMKESKLIKGVQKRYIDKGECEDDAQHHVQKLYNELYFNYI